MVTSKAGTVLAAVVLLLSSVLTACGSDKSGSSPTSPATSAAASGDLATAAVDAYTFGYPLVTMEYTRRAFTNTVEPQAVRTLLNSRTTAARTVPAFDVTMVLLTSSRAQQCPVLTP